MKLHQPSNSAQIDCALLFSSYLINKTMPANRNALIRYKTIDQCLQNRYRKWTLNDLIDACSDALFEYEGIDKGVSKRTIQLDIQTMRSDKLGYNAPIVVTENKYYSYEDSEYSITRIPLTHQDLNLLKGVVSTLEQFQSFSHFSEFSGIVKKLEDQLHVKVENAKPIIDFDKNKNLKGLEYIDMCYQAIARKSALEITYKSFKAKQASTFTFHPQFLKEFNNRWFLIGTKARGQAIMNIALDRIHDIDFREDKYYIDLKLNPEDYYSEIIGVSLSQNTRVQKVIFFVDADNAPYVETKPFHHSQKILENTADGITFQIEVQPNFELERLLLGFGSSLMVLKPRRLKGRIKKNLEKAYHQY